MKGGAGCSVPWHWHPSTENIMMVSGTAHTAIKNEKPVQLSAGRFLSVPPQHVDRKSTRLNSSHSQISYAVFCLEKKKKQKLYEEQHTSVMSIHLHL